MIEIIDAGLVEYGRAYDLQKNLVIKRRRNLIGDTVMIGEHLPVFTTGRKGLRRNLLIAEDELKRMGIRFIEVDRGGDITFHGPGQIVLYPILNLNEHGRDVHKYIRRLEEVMIGLLSLYNVTGLRMPGYTGVWLDEDAKIGSIGIGIKNWVTYHGLSININTPLSYFEMIRPCGLGACRMASLSSVLGRHIDMDEAKRKLLDCFMDTFLYPSLRGARDVKDGDEAIWQVASSA